MTGQLIPFNFDDNLIRSAMIDGQPWFVATDIARVLDYSRERDMHRILDSDEKGAHIVRTPGGDQEMTVINQSGLYHAILKSRKPEARRFRKWVTAELLPELNRTGSYSLIGQGERLRLESEKLRMKRRDSAIKLLDRIGKEHRAEVREALHAVLEQDFQAMGIDTPSLEAIGCRVDASQPQLEAFWEALEYLQASGTAINHSADPSRLAISLPHLQRIAADTGIRLPAVSLLRRAFKGCRDPELIGYQAVRSTITGVTIKCWVFSLTADSPLASASLDE